MNTKEFDKKLVLNKKTVANLNDSAMKVIKAGRTLHSFEVSLCPATKCEYCRP